MDSQQYSKREEDAWRDEVRNRLARIEEQTTKTNGNVRKLQLWRAYILGGMAMLSVLLIGILIPIIAALIVNHVI